MINGVAANVDTRSLNDGYPFSGGYYVVGCGYMYLNQTVRYYDVWYGNEMPGYHTVSTSHMVYAIKNQYKFLTMKKEAYYFKFTVANVSLLLFYESHEFVHLNC